VLIYTVAKASTLDASDANQTLPFPGLDDNDEPPLFGISVLSADINGDFYPDLVVGAPGEDGASNAPDRGAVYIYYYAQSSGGYSDPPDVTLFGAAFEQIGTAITVTDLNGDQRLELVIGAPATESVYIVPSQDLSAGSYELTDLPNMIRVYSNAGSGTFGQSVANAGDLIVDAHNLPELIIAAPQMTVTGSTAAFNQGLLVAIPGTKVPFMDYNATP
jgi:hypothetical protein